MNSSVYHTLHVFNEDRLVIALDYDNKVEAIRESIAFREEGFPTELLTLSTANVFDTTPDIQEMERIAY